MDTKFTMPPAGGDTVDLFGQGDPAIANRPGQVVAA
jgi:hypothetical protein